jgi:hypothetical protein
VVSRRHTGSHILVAQGHTLKRRLC